MATLVTAATQASGSTHDAAMAQHAQQQQQLSRRMVLQLPLAAATCAAAAAHSGAALWLPPTALAADAPGPRALSPEAQAAVDKTLRRLLGRAKTPGALRLVFHDAGTFSAADGDGGINASIRFELSRPENFGLKKIWKLVEQAHDSLAGTAAEGQVSLADMVALAGAHAVALTGGPVIRVPVGRAVADSASGDPTGRMPGENFSVEQLKANFAAKGFTVQEMVALSGAHTLGSKGFGDPTTFDNTYYVELLKKPWLNTADEMAAMTGLPSDHVLPDDPECIPWIQTYARDQQRFFTDFAAAYVKLCSLGVRWT